MLASIYIENYRLFDKLEVPRLGQINLITGKNDSGKSAFLEAVQCFQTDFQIEVINTLLAERGERTKLVDTKLENKKLKAVYGIYQSIFPRHQNTAQIPIKIRSGDKTVRAYLGIANPLNGATAKDTSSIPVLTDLLFNPSKSTPSTSINEELYLFVDVNDKVNKKLLGNRANVGAIVNAFVDFGDENYNLLSMKSIPDYVLGYLWDKIVFTDKEDYIIQALKIIEPNIQDLAFTGEGGLRKPTVKLNGHLGKLPLASFGDGIKRILQIILAIAAAEKGYLLIDEVDIGLHHEVQEQMWQLVFELSAKTGVQIFATTHSMDCIKAFTEVAIKNSQLDSQYFRIGKTSHTNQFKVTYYSLEQLETAIVSQIETR
ncbi:MAG: AAA family ATPase [Bacteroidota bacterium]